MPTQTLVVIPEDIELRENNPYSIGSVFVFEEGDYELDREPITYNPSIRDKYVTTEQGDTLGSIAWAQYGSSKYWWILADVNPDIEWLSPLWDIADGTTLLIPDLRKLQITD